MLDRAEVMRPGVKRLVWLDPDQCQRVPYNTLPEANQAIQEVWSISATTMPYCKDDRDR
jgi:hypothetical protein